jgi:hypothetical protein
MFNKFISLLLDLFYTMCVIVGTFSLICVVVYVFIVMISMLSLL